MSSLTPSPRVPTTGGEVPGDLGHFTAMLVSYVVNPLVLPPLVYGSVLAHGGAPGSDVARGAGVGLVFFALVPLIHVVWMRARGRIESLEIRDRSERTEPFLVVLGAGILAFVVVLATDISGARLLAALVGCHVVNTGLLLLMTAHWKISVHCASVAGAVGTLAFARYHVPGGMLDTAVVGRAVMGGGAILVPIMVWARVRSRAHTLRQAVAGAGLGLAAPYLELLTLAHSVGL